MSANSVIVFGPTGAVGSFAAQEAAERGAKVWLAMRDPSKKLDFVSADAEQKGTYDRVQADLSEPGSVKQAIEKSGAKSAFIYIAHGVPDGMRLTIQALKDAGVTWVVLLSSFTIRVDPYDVPKQDAIPRFHADVEIALQEVGIPFAAVRPGAFASNIFMWWVPGFKKGNLSLYAPNADLDFIVTDDIGRVAGALLTQPKPDSKPTEPEIVYLLGPKLWPQKEAAAYVARAIGYDKPIGEETEEEYRTRMIGAGAPAPIVDYMARSLVGKTPGNTYESGFHTQCSDNVYKYSGKQPVTFEEYIDKIKPQLTS